MGADRAARLPAGAPGPAPPVAGAASHRQWYVLSLLTLAMCISFADRYVLAMLVQPIKADLHLSDTAISVLNGFAFSAFYATFGLLTARLADRGRSRQVILASLVIWSVMTALCGAAQTFLQLLLVRFAVGAGEAGVAPSSHAIITRMFPAGRRATALAVFNAGGALGILAAFAASGALEARLGWRLTFVVMGGPGLILAAVAFATMGDVGSAPDARAAGSASGTLRRDVFLLFRSARLRQLLVALSAVAFLAFGQTQWLPAFLERQFGAARSAIGPLLALTQGVGLLAGLLTGGLLSDHLGRLDERWRLRVITISMIATIPFVLGTYVVPDLTVACICAGLAGFLIAIPGGPLWSAVQDELPPANRATGAASVMLVSGLFGLGFGPFVIGMLSDALEPWRGRQALGSALLIAVGLCCVAILMVLRALHRSETRRRAAL